MTRDDILRMAREAGFKDHGNPELWDYMVVADEVIERFFKLAYEAGAKDEREACAQVGMLVAKNGIETSAAIRERGNK